MSDETEGLVRHALSARLIAKARIAQKAGKETQFSVEDPWGLYVRVRKRELAYYVQARTPPVDGKSTTLKRRVCTVGVRSFDEIKRIATKAINAIKDGDNVDAKLRALLAGGDENDVEIAVDRADARKAELWTFGQLIDAYVARRKPAPKTDQPKLRPRSIREIMDRLRNRPEAAVLMNMYVKALRLDDLESVKEAIREENEDAPTAHAKFVVLSKRILKWGHKHRRLKLGLKPEDGWWNVLSHEHRLGDRSGRMLTPAQVGTLIALVEAVRATEPNTSDAVLGALQSCWIIVQRVDALTEMKALSSQKNWVPDPLRIGWIVYTWTSDEVKGDREIKMSVPPIAIDIINRVALSTETILTAPSRYAFPQISNKYRVRAAVAADRQRASHAMTSGRQTAQARIEVPENMDKPITESSLNHALDSLGGRREGSLDVLSMVGLPNKIGPHDLRRSVTHYFDQIGEAAYASALLDHKVTGKDKMDREVAAITQGVYSSADRVIFKAEGLVRWMEAVLPEHERAKTDPRIAQAVAARIAHLTKKRREGGRKSGLSRATARPAVE